MVGPLILRNTPPTQPREAISKQYLEQFLAYATGMPVGAVFAFASASNPAGYLLCNGQAVSRTVYATLFAAIGTIFGSGDGATTFNVPDMRDWFVRGRGDGRQLGSTQTSAFASHAHPFQDPGHTHGASQDAHNHSAEAHTHGINDPGHSHTVNAGDVNIGANWGLHPSQSIAGPVATSGALTGVQVKWAPTLGTDWKQPAMTVQSASTGASIGSTGDAETRPQNIALDYYIKAVNDSTQVGAVTGITSSNAAMISINSANPVVPELVLHANVSYGIPQLDANGKVLLAQLPISNTSLLGYFDASQGGNPSQIYPATDYVNGQAYIVSVAGTISVRNPQTSVESLTAVAVGGTLIYLEGQSQPDGWYYSIPVSADNAVNISFLPEGTISATNVQAAIAELDSETQAALAGKLNLTGGALSGSLVINGAAVTSSVGGSGGAAGVVIRNLPASNAVQTTIENALSESHLVAHRGNLVLQSLLGSVVVSDDLTVTGGVDCAGVSSSGQLASIAPDGGRPLSLRNSTANTVAFAVDYVGVDVQFGNVRGGKSIISGSEVAALGALSAGTNLHVAGSATLVGGASINASNLLTWNASTGQAWYSLAEAGGNFVIAGLNNPGSGAYLPSSGGNWVALSDERFKCNLRPYGSVLSGIMGLRAVIGNYNGSDTDHPFLLAQDVLQVFPEAVESSNPDKLGMAYGDMVPILVRAIQELTAKVEALEAKCAGL
jgi:microcystin-dependent protein